MSDIAFDLVASFVEKTWRFFGHAGLLSAKSLELFLSAHQRCEIVGVIPGMEFYSLQGRPSRVFPFGWVHVQVR